MSRTKPSLPTWVRPSPSYGVPEEVLAQQRNPDILPDQPEFTAKYKYFHHLLYNTSEKQDSLEKILADNFTKQDAKLITPSNRPDLRQQQRGNAARYHQIVRDKFQDYDPDDLALKLTFVHFGLPVAPIVLPFEKLIDQLEVREPEAPLYDVQPPLHFLTAHKERNWGMDEKRGQEEVAWPLEVQQQLNIIPGPSTPIDDTDGSSVKLSLRGGAAEEDEEDAEMTDDESEQDTTVRLFGFQGWIDFDITRRKSFAAAVRDLLAISFQKGADFTIVVFDSASRQPFYEIEGKWPIKSNSNAWKQVCAVNRMSGIVLFVKGGSSEKTPSQWEPGDSQGQNKVAKVQLPDGSACCYIAFPAQATVDVVTSWGSNYYTPYIKTALEVLIGRTMSGSHHALFQLATPNQPKPAPYSYGLHAIHPLELRSLFSANSTEHHVLNYETLEAGSVVLLLPGFPAKAPAYTTKDGVDIDTGSSLVVRRETREGDDFPGYHAGLDAVRDFVKPCFAGEAFFEPTHAMIIPLGGAVHRDQLSVGQRIDMRPDPTQKVLEERQFSDFFRKMVSIGRHIYVIHPQWKAGGPRMLPAWQVHDKGKQDILMPPLCDERDRPSRPEFWNAMKQIISHHSNPRLHINDNSIVRLKTLPTGDLPAPTDAASPPLFLSALGNDAEWSDVRSMVATSAVSVEIVQPQLLHWKHEIASSNIWGPRYGEMAHNNLPKVPPTVRKNKGKDREPKSASAAGPSRGPAFTSENAHHPPQSTRESSLPTRDNRHSSWFKQPSAFINLGFQLPITAPGADHVLRSTTSVPMISKAILTPTEQARLQTLSWNMRNMLLQRSVNCPFEECDFACRENERERLMQHIRGHAQDETPTQRPSPATWATRVIDKGKEKATDPMNANQQKLPTGKKSAASSTGNQGISGLRMPPAPDVPSPPLPGSSTSSTDEASNGQDQDDSSGGDTTDEDTSSEDSTSNEDSISEGDSASGADPTSEEDTSHEYSTSEGDIPHEYYASRRDTPHEYSTSEGDTPHEYYTSRGDTPHEDSTSEEEDSVEDKSTSSDELAREEDTEDEPEILGTRRRWRSRVHRASDRQDQNYQYRSDSDTELVADEQAMQQVVPEDDDDENPSSSKKRRKISDGTYKPTEENADESGDDEQTQEMEGPAKGRKRLLTSSLKQRGTGNAPKTTTQASTTLKKTPTKTTQAKTTPRKTPIKTTQAKTTPRKTPIKTIQASTPPKETPTKTTRAKTTPKKTQTTKQAQTTPEKVKPTPTTRQVRSRTPAKTPRNKGSTEGIISRRVTRSQSALQSAKEVDR